MVTFFLNADVSLPLQSPGGEALTLLYSVSVPLSFPSLCPFLVAFFLCPAMSLWPPVGECPPL